MIEISKYCLTYYVYYDIIMLGKWTFGCKASNRSVSRDYPIGDVNHNRSRA